MHNDKRCIAAAVLSALGALPAQAEEPRLQEVQVVDVFEAVAERRDAPVQKIVVSEEDVERYGDATVGDVLRRLPGMTFTGPAGVAKDVRMRGLDKGYTQFLINGEPVPTATKERQIQVDRLPADMIERVEIIRSPSAAYDASGIGGTINIVLKSRADNLTRLRAAAGRNGSLDVGDVVAQWSRRFETLDVLLAASHTVGAEDVSEDKVKYKANGTFDNRELKEKPVKKTETLLAPRLTWRLGADRLTLEPFVSSGTEEKREVTDTLDKDDKLTKSKLNREDKDDTIARIAGRYDGKTSWGGWHVKLGSQEARTTKDKSDTESDKNGVATKRTTEDEKVRERNVYAGAGVDLPLGAHALSAGLEWRDGEFDNRKLKAETDFKKGTTSDKTNPKEVYEVEERRLIAWVQDQWQLASRHWLTPGVRVERLERESTDSLANVLESDNSATSPSLHYRWAVLDDLNLRASAARTTRFPKFDQLNPFVESKSGSLTDPDKAGNPDLKPERATGYEVGLEKFFLGTQGAVGLNFYYRDVEDFVEKVSRLEGARYVERPQNVGEARFWGAELDWRVPLLRSGSHRLTLTGSHAELRGRVKNSTTGIEQDVKDKPPRVTNLGLDWQHGASGWSAGLAVNHVPTFTSDSTNDDDKREIKTLQAATLLDLYLGKRFSPLAELRVIAKNVLSVDKDEAKTVYKAGAVESAERKVERSEPTILVTFESRF